MSSSGAGAKQWTVKFDMSEKELMQNVIANLLEILCSYFECITQNDLNALRSARENYVNREVNMDALLAEISVVKENCKERMDHMGEMDRVKQAESSLKKAIEDIRNELDHWPVSAKGSLSLVCDEKQKLLRSIADQRQQWHPEDEEDDAYKRISLFLAHERQLLKNYFTYVKNDPKPKHLDYSTFAADITVLDSIGADRPLHLHKQEQIKHLTDKPRGFLRAECKKYLCPFQHQFHYHECKLSDCHGFHVYPCYNRECGQPHFNPRVCNGFCDGNECDEHPNILKFGDSLYLQQNPSESDE